MKRAQNVCYVLRTFVDIFHMFAPEMEAAKAKYKEKMAEMEWWKAEAVKCMFCVYASLRLFILFC